MKPGVAATLILASLLLALIGRPVAFTLIGSDR